MWYIPKKYKSTDFGVAFLMGSMCAAISTGPVGIALASVTHFGQLVWILRRYKKEKEYAARINPIMHDMVVEYMRIHARLAEKKQENP